MSPKRISTSKQIFLRFERRKNWRKFVAISYLAIYASYLLWRCTILNQDSLTLSILYLLAEFLGFLAGLGIIIKCWRHNYRTPKPVLENRSVDIFVTTYLEPAHIIRRTLIAAKAIEYPHRTVVLDDGRRPEIKKIAEEIGVDYLSRPKNLHAKAGNLNFGLEHSSAEFVMVLDADHIALPHALKITLGFFADDKIAMVQAPQDYYNTTAFQNMNCKKTGALWHDQSFFYNVSQPCLDSVNCASGVGTGVIYRRSALDVIGGIPTESLTEDTLTSVRMNNFGYHTIYLNESIAYGIASSDLEEYYKTRRRWSHGNIQIFRIEKIFRNKNLSLFQKILQVPHLLNFLDGWQQLLLISIPICTLLFGLSPFEISVFNVVITFCFPFIIYVLLQELGCGFSRFWNNEIFSMIRWPILVRVTGAWFGKNIAWSSSLKNIKGRVNWRLMLPQLIVLAMSVIALLVAFLTLQKVGFKTGPLFLFLKERILELFGLADPNYIPISIHAKLKAGYTFDLVLVAGSWVLYNIIRVIFLIHKVISDSKNSHEFFRFDTPFPVTINAEKKIFGKILQIAEDWLEYCESNAADAAEKIGNRKKILLHLPARILEVEIEIEKIVGRNISGKIIWNSIEARDQLAEAIYSVDWHREFVNRHAYFLTPSDRLLKLFNFEVPNSPKYQEWNSLLYQGNPAVVANLIKQKNLGSIILFEEKKIGSVIAGLRISENKIEEVKLEILEEESLSSLVEKGLDGAVTWRYKVRIL